ncbi:MAG: putative sensor protein [Candidatus Saccharibacteria bacterium]|nr:putative sensor protein [Candidatus Saccharibacteria bacterium]
MQAALLIYLLLSATAAGLIVTTGGTTSPFIALWMLVTVFAGVFGVWGLLPILIGICTFVASEYLHGRFGVELVVLSSFAGLLPLIASFIIWHNKGKSESDSGGGDKAYKELATELSQVASQSEVVINAIGDGVMAIDPQGIIQLINPAAQRILGWGKQDSLALNYKSVLQLTNLKNEPLDATNDPVQQVLNTNQQVRNDDVMIITHNGKKIMGSLVISPTGDVGSGAIIVFRDITKEKAEEREQAEFISTASHEMRTPVASIEGFLGLALNANVAQIDDKARDFIMKAHESTQHLGRLFQDLLDVSKAEDGRLMNMPKVMDVIPFVHDVLQGLQQKATDKGLRLIYKPLPDDGTKHVTPVYTANIDNDHLREVVNNLTENAIKYTPKGEVIVDVTGTDDKVVISVKDSGIGIPAEDMPHLFQKFYRVDNAETNQIGGTGLGLYLCRRLAEAMGGRIWAESEYKKGSTFYLEVPRIGSQEAAALSAEQAQQAQREAADAAAHPIQAATFDPNTPIPVDLPRTTSSGSAPAIQAATTVPRGESLSREQIAAHVAKLRAMAKEQAESEATASPEPTAETPNSEPAVSESTPATEPTPRSASISIPVREVAAGPPQT